MEQIIMITPKIRSYSDLKRINTFEERYEYLRLTKAIGEITFGFDRYLNQMFYRSLEWKKVRNLVIIRDNACDLGIEEREIFDQIVIHHMNPITINDVEFDRDLILNPEYLICTSSRTHSAIHYGDKSKLFQLPVERQKNDTIPWHKI